MKIISDYIVFSVLILLAIFLFCGPVGAVGLGMGPTLIEVNDAMRGSEHLDSLAIFNPENTNLNVALVVEGDVAGWISFYEGDAETPVSQLLIPAKGSVVLDVRILVPEDAANGMYKSEIYAEIVPDSGAESSGVGTTFRTSSKISIYVTDNEILEGTAGNFAVGDTEEGAPLLIEVQFSNTGNVVAVPDVSADILKDGKTVGTVSESGISVSPGESRTIKLEWDTADQEIGEYEAHVSLFLGGTVLEKQSLTFNLFPEGTFSRNGELSALVFEGRPHPDKLLKIVGKFNNTGEMSTKVKLVGEVYKDGSLEDTFSTDEIIVSTYVTEDLPYYQKVETGEYIIKAYAIYDNKKTGEQELSFTVGADAASGQPEGTATASTPLSLVTVFMSLIIVMMVISVLRKQ